MDISAEVALPGRDVAAIAASYGMLSGQNTDTGGEDMLMPEIFVMRFRLDGEWMHCTSREHWTSTPPAAIWGSASSVIKLRCPGQFRVFSIALRTAAWLELSGLPSQDFVDRVFSLEPFFGPDVARFHRALQKATNMQAMAELADGWLAGLKRCKIRPLLIERARTFEDFTLLHWERPIADIAEEFHLSTRQLERMTLQGMGLKPKLITRRHRFLNVAAAMRGVGDVEWQELCYRYYSDQSHMSREFRKFADMAPGEFREAHAPLLDITLRLRHLSHKMLAAPGGRDHFSQDLPMIQRRI